MPTQQSFPFFVKCDLKRSRSTIHSLLQRDIAVNEITLSDHDHLKYSVVLQYSYHSNLTFLKMGINNKFESASLLMPPASFKRSHKRFYHPSAVKIMKRCNMMLEILLMLKIIISLDTVELCESCREAKPT